MSLILRLSKTTLLASLLLAGAACGDDDGSSDGSDNPGDPDAAIVDEPDAAPPPSHRAFALFVEADFVDGANIPPGAGPFIQIFNFEDSGFPPTPTTPDYEQMEGSQFACKAWEWTQAESVAPGLDFGELQFSVDEGPEIPPCRYIEGQGYRCVGTMGSTGVITANGGPSFTLTNDAVTFGADEAGRHVIITGSAVGPNNGTFPITASTADSITYVNAQPGAMAEDPTAASYTTVAGLGPNPVAADIPDDGVLTTELTAGDADGGFEDFDTQNNFGDSFTPDDATMPLLTNIPMDGEAFTLSCDGEGGDCGTAMATGVIIQTTDGDVTGLPPFILPPAQDKVVRIFCLFLTGAATIPAEASQFLADSGATRVRTFMGRANPSNVTQADGIFDVTAGHALIGFTTIPQ